MIALLAAAAVAAPPALPSAPVVCTAPIARDGDNVSCQVAGQTKSDKPKRVNVRLLGIDAPELPGHCRRGRVCAPGDPFASLRSLQLGVAQGPVTYRTLTIDRYGRPVAVMTAGTINLSCWQLQRDSAMYVARWDQGGHIARACGK